MNPLSQAARCGRRAIGALPVLGTLAALAGLAAPAPAQTVFVVNDLRDLVDFDLGDGACDADPNMADNQCTLRAAIQNAMQIVGWVQAVLGPSFYRLENGGTDDVGVFGDLDVFGTSLGAGCYPRAMLHAIAWILVAATLGAQAPAEEGAPNRRTESLDGPWQVRALETRRGAPPEGWREIRVPSAFETVLGLDFDGLAEYRRELEIGPPGEGERYSVRFGAVMTEARVYLNEEEIGHHLGGWTPFRCELPEGAFRDGAQELRVVVDEKVGHNTQGFLPVIQPHFGGIWQSVELTLESGPAFDPDAVELLAELEEGAARVRVLFDALPRGVVRLRLLDGERELVTRTFPAGGGDEGLREELVAVGQPVRPWGPGAAHQYRAVLTYHEADGAPAADRITRWLAFREIEVEGRLIRLNGAPLSVRGVLHWGYEPPALAPNPPASVWREEMRLVKSLGFNLVKACLWLPPPSFFEVAQEEGVLVWQEYPAWHPDFSEQHLDDLLREYSEFFLVDRGRAPIVARSLTCETGHAAASDAVVRELYERCKELTGAKLVVDDSSWITWSRYHDFYDDHPYGNHAPWVGRLEGFDRHIEQHGAKPLLLGEAMAAGTWIDFEALERALGGDLSGDDLPWWRPNALPSRQAFEERMAKRLGEGARQRLLPESLQYALTGRKYQFESFRRVLPEAGYVSTVLRDIRHCQMGYIDHADRPKWTAEDFSWHGERMLVLDDPRAIRSVALGQIAGFSPALRVAGDVEPLAGEGVLRLRKTLERHDGRGFAEAAAFDGGIGVTLEAEGPLSSALLRAAAETPLDGRGRVVRCRLAAELEGGPRNAWTFWAVPEAPSPRVPEGVRVAHEVSLELLDWVEAGGRLLLLPGGQGAPRSRSLWFLRGAPFGPLAHPLLERVPRELLFDLQPFDLDGPLFASTELTRAFDLVLGFWDTHDLLGEELDEYAFLLEARAGEGRILACSLGLDAAPEEGLAGGPPAANPARAWLMHSLLLHLSEGPAPRSALPAETLEAWRGALTARKVELGGTWLLQPDPDDVGQEEAWERPPHDDSGWMEARTGVHWEAIGLPHYDGVAWYRKRFETPDFWTPGEPLHLIFDGVDDSYTLYVNGERVASFGDPLTGESVWLVRTHADVAPFVQPGQNLIAVRVVDHVGAGGLHRRVWLSTQPPEMEDLITR